MQLTLEYKGVPFILHRMDVADQQHRSSAFLALQPHQKMSAPQTSDTALHEAVAIVAFLDRAYSDKPLLVVTPVPSAR